MWSGHQAGHHSSTWRSIERNLVVRRVVDLHVDKKRERLPNGTDEKGWPVIRHCGSAIGKRTGQKEQCPSTR